MKTVHVRIPETQLAQLQALALREERSLAWVIRRGLRNYVETQAETSQDTTQRVVIRGDLGMPVSP